MVKYEYILKAMENHIDKCYDYPKAIALKNFNRDNFKEETWDKEYGFAYMNKNSSPPGKLFSEQDDLQDWKLIENMDNDVYSDIELLDETDYKKGDRHIEFERKLFWRYQTNTFAPISYYINGDWENLTKFFEEAEELGLNFRHDKDVPYDDWEILYKFNEDINYIDVHSVIDSNGNTVEWEEVEPQYSVNRKEWVKLKDVVNDLDFLIDDFPRIKSDCVVHRYGRLPTDNEGNAVKEGGHGKFKGFTSTTYNPYIVDDHSDMTKYPWMDKENRYNLTIYVPSGTKGVVLGNSLQCQTFENELLLGRNQRCVVLNRDDESRTAEILLY